jgi:hypothetical protein
MRTETGTRRQLERSLERHPDLQAEGDLSAWRSFRWCLFVVLLGLAVFFSTVALRLLFGPLY